jgi:hypothetical protein
MSSLSDSDLQYYKRIKLIDEIKILALDFVIQKSLIPKEIQSALAYELLDDWDIFYVDEENIHKFPSDGYFIQFLDEINQLDQLIQVLEEHKSYSVKDVEEGKDWEEIRMFCRSLLRKMGEENDFPDSRKPGWRFLSQDHYGVFDDV